MELKDLKSTVDVKHAVISITEQTVKELVKAIEKAKGAGLKDAIIYVFSEYSAIDFKINIGDNIESLGYKLRDFSELKSD